MKQHFFRQSIKIQLKAVPILCQVSQDHNLKKLGTGDFCKKELLRPRSSWQKKVLSTFLVQKVLQTTFFIIFFHFRSFCKFLSCPCARFRKINTHELSKSVTFPIFRITLCSQDHIKIGIDLKSKTAPRNRTPIKVRCSKNWLWHTKLCIDAAPRNF